jgi:dipeptidyl aminopeptidase/acylaminoacyl peptidase
VLIDQQGQQWAQNGQAVDLGLNSAFPGATLLALHPSPDQRLIVADIAFGESVQSVVVDLSTGISHPIFSDGPARFLAWAQDSQNVIIEPPVFPLEVWTLNVASQDHRLVDFPKSDFGDSLVRAVADSPDGSQIADAVVYPATVSNPTEKVEIGVRTGEQGIRQPLACLSGGNMIAEHSLRWSPDGHNLIFVTDVLENGRSTQLWMINVPDGTSRMLMQLAEGVQYNHPAIWSPDGRYIAVLRVEQVYNGEETANNILTFDLETETTRQLTRFANQRLTQFEWSPDGQQLAFTISMGDYGEIWTTDLNGERLQPIAGPTTPDAPLVWLP